MQSVEKVDSDKWWEVLGVDRDAPIEVIRQTYDDLTWAERHGPDKNRILGLLHAAWRACQKERGGMV